jgi:trans-resveratrol di-O-methyltransferase
MGISKGEARVWQLINEAMASQCRKVMRDVVTSCPQLFQGLRSLVDVGGGIGTTVKAIAREFPELRCTVFDLPHVISNVPKNELFDAVGGSMFERVPAADAILMKVI